MKVDSANKQNTFGCYAAYCSVEIFNLLENMPQLELKKVTINCSHLDFQTLQEIKYQTAVRGLGDEVDSFWDWIEMMWLN